MNLVPQPKEIIYRNGTFSLPLAFTVTPAVRQAYKVAWELFTIPVSAAEEAEETIAFYENANLQEEEYELLIGKSGIEIFSSGSCGAFRALSTLKQLLAQQTGGTLACMKIHDKPDIPVRGIMLTLRDQYVPKLETLYRLVDQMAAMKYNMFQLYFDTFVFEYESFREHLEGMSYMTQEEIHKLDAYCQERHIQLMANQELLGHMYRWLSKDAFKHLGIQGAEGTVNPLLEETFTHAKQMLDDLLPHFSSGYVHIGMDEAIGLGEGDTEQFAKTFGEATLLADYIQKISGYIKEKHHKRSMFWGDYAVKYADAMKMIPKDTIFVDWGYEPAHSFDRNIRACKEAGLEVYVAPGTQTWGTFSGKTDVMLQNIYEAAEAGRFHKVQGFLLTDWGVNDVPTISLLSYTFGAALSWNGGYNDSIAESGNEENCHYRNQVIHNVLAYFDREILKSIGDRSCADLIYRMGNYYHCEQPLSAATWNGTMLYNSIFSKTLAWGTLSPEALLDIVEYMERLKGKLSECKLACEDSQAILEELELVADVVIAAANAVGIDNAPTAEWAARFSKPDAKALVARYRKRWTQINKLTPSTEEVINRWLALSRDDA